MVATIMATKPQPTTSADEALAGAQLPFGGHKGAAIAMMVELLAAGAAAATATILPILQAIA